MSPISPSKASGISPQTSSTSSNPDRSATTTATTSSSYTPAQPGSAPFPGPTGYAQRYTPLQPTPTTNTEADDGPSPPQPGALPIPRSTGVAPPPKVGEKYKPPNPPTSQPIPQPYPSQMSIPPPGTPIGARPPASFTGPTTTASATYPVAIPATEYDAPRRSLEHPPGYQQNEYASELTSDQRRALEANNLTGLEDSSAGVGGINTENIWNTAKQWASTAGNRISETEAEIWRRINKE